MSQTRPAPAPAGVEPVGLAFRARVAVAAWEASRVARAEPAVVRRLQAERLGALLRDVTTRSDYFRRKYAGCPLDLEGLARLPVMTKDDWRRDFDAAVLDPAVTAAGIEQFTGDLANLGRLYLGKYVVFKTSGSTGGSLPLVYDGDAMLAFFAAQMGRASVLGGASLLEGLKRLWEPFRFASLGTGPLSFHSGSTLAFSESMASPFVRFRRFITRDPDFEAQLRGFRPHALMGSPGILTQIVLRARELDLSGSLRQVTSTGEVMAPALRRQLETAFGAKVTDHYGAGECLFMGEGCQAGPGIHVNADWAILEVLDEDDRPVPPGRLGARLLVTNLANRVQPMIRYELPDRLVMAAGDCGCGNRLPLIERVEGRLSEELEFRGGGGTYLLQVSPVCGVMCLLPEVLAWRVRQLAPDALQAEWVRAPGAPAADTAERLAAGFRRIGMPGWVRFSVRELAEIPPDLRTGKAPRFLRFDPGAAGT